MKRVWGAHVRTPEEDGSQRNAYVNPLELAYVVTDHLRLWSGTSLRLSRTEGYDQGR